MIQGSMRSIQDLGSIGVPAKAIGPVKIFGPEVDDEVMVPLATFESPLWPSTQRGAKVTRLAGGIRAVIVDDRMTRSIILEADNCVEAARMIEVFRCKKEQLEQVVAASSRFCRLVDMNFQIVGNLLFVRFEMETGDAAGHNMVTHAASNLISWIMEHYPELKYVSISGNYCTDKKATDVNGILGRGKYVVAELVIERDLCIQHLKTTPEKIAELNVKKNLIGTTLAGGMRTANAHFANILLAFYLATGQDAANIVEGSQGIVHAEVRDGDLYFSVTVPNIIVGAVGNGKGLDFAARNLEELGCMQSVGTGFNARRLAIIIGATILCGELSLLAAQTNPGQLMRAHLTLERSGV